MRPAHGFTVVGTLAGLLLALVLAPGRPRAAQRGADPTLPQLLAAAARYVADYETSFGLVVAEERYQQSTNGPARTTSTTDQPTRRVTTGDVLMFNSGGAGWMAFRDVHTVDGSALPASQGRLAALAAAPTRETLAEAMRATAASAAYTIGGVPRAPAIPTAALTYLRAASQPFGVFELDGMKTVSDVRVAVLTFSERPHARETDADDVTLTGRFWIEPETGLVVQTEVSLRSTAYESKVEVQYAGRSGIDGWVPVRMLEQYNVAIASQGGTRLGVVGRGGASTKAYVDGLATYEAFRRFDLQPGLVIK